MPATTKKKPDTGLTLTKATEVGRVVVKFGGLVLVVLMVGRLLVNSFVAFWIATHPEPPPPPTQGFGALPALDFGTGGSAISPESYKLELAESFPLFPDRAMVYLIPKSQIGLLSLEEAKVTAAKMGFQSEPVALDSERYRWRRSGEINATLELNIVTNNFEFATDYLSRPEAQVKNELPDTFDAVQTVKQFLKSSDLLPADIATAAGQTQFLKISGGALKEAVSLSDAQVIRVNLFRVLPYGESSYTSDGKTGLISATVASINGKATVIELNRMYEPIEYQLGHTYPLRTVEEAWQLLKAGEGFVANAQREDLATIREVSLGYFEMLDQLYLQPVFVFTGDDGFVGLVPALDPSAQFAPDPPPVRIQPASSAQPGTIAL
jgi:hypothetical protein